MTSKPKYMRSRRVLTPVQQDRRNMEKILHGHLDRFRSLVNCLFPTIFGYKSEINYSMLPADDLSITEDDIKKFYHENIDVLNKVYTRTMGAKFHRTMEDVIKFYIVQRNYLFTNYSTFDSHRGQIRKSLYGIYSPWDSFEFITKKLDQLSLLNSAKFYPEGRLILFRSEEDVNLLKVCLRGDELPFFIDFRYTEQAILKICSIDIKKILGDI